MRKKWRALAGTMAGVMILSCTSMAAWAVEEEAGTEIPAAEETVTEDIPAGEDTAIPGTDIENPVEDAAPAGDAQNVEGDPAPAENENTENDAAPAGDAENTAAPADNAENDADPTEILEAAEVPEDLFDGFTAAEAEEDETLSAAEEMSAAEFGKTLSPSAMAGATPIVPGQTVPVNVTSNVAGHAFLKFSPAYSLEYTLESASSYDPAVYIYDKNGEYIDEADDIDYDNKILNFKYTKAFTAGEIYYFEIYAYDWEDSEGPYPVSITLTAGAHDHIYGEWVVTKPAAYQVDGEEIHTCAVCNGTETRPIPAFTVSKAPSLLSVKPAKKGPKATAKMNKLKKPKKAKKSKKGKKAKKKTTLWDEVKKVEIQYSLDPEFKESVRTRTAGKQKAALDLRGLQKGSTYYVRARYIGGGGYSDWSKVKTVRVKADAKKGKKKKK